jgi:hypothetical protein
VKLVDRIPEHLIRRDGFIEIALGVETIRTAVRQTEFLDTRGMHGSFGDLGPIRVGVKDLNPVNLIRRGLTACPDDIPSPETHELSFIGDADLREALRRDLSATNDAFVNGEWKAATVLAGSILEALLLWAIQTIDPPKIEVARQAAVDSRLLRKKPTPDPNEWHLPEYIEVAFKLELIQEPTANQTRLAKDFRNLIHPGKSVRLGQECNKGTALAAAAAIEFVTADLTKRLSQSPAPSSP